MVPWFIYEGYSVAIIGVLIADYETPDKIGVVGEGFNECVADWAGHLLPYRMQCISATPTTRSSIRIPTTVSIC